MLSEPLLVSTSNMVSEWVPANKRRFTARSAYDGRAQEWEVATTFTAATAMALQWPRMAGVLRRLATSYQHDAKREDDETSLEHNLGL